MIDPVSLAVMALTSAIIAGAKEAGKNAGGDSYQLLKGYLIRRYGHAAEVGIANLERQPGAREYRDDLTRVLHGMDAEQDRDLGGLAQRLYDLVEEGVKDDPLEQPKRAAGVNAVGRLLETHIQSLSDIRSRFPVGDSQLLSSDMATAPNIPQELRAQVSTLHERMRAIIQQVAVHIENDKYQEAEQLPQTLPNLIERERAARLVQADKAIHISYGSLALAVSFFSELNETILARIEHERSVQRQTQMMFGNAIMIYELAAFAIDFITDFTLGGVSEVEALHQDTMSRIAKAHEAQERLTANANREGVEPAVRDGILEDIRHRAAALDFFRDEWNRYVSDTKQFHKRVEEVQNKIPTLELIRENARVQLDVLELVAMLRFLRQNADAVRATVESLQGFRLAPLTPARVRRLIGPAIGG
jgi:hypothetical protein